MCGRLYLLFISLLIWVIIMLLWKVVVFISVGVFLVFGLVYRLFLWLVLQLVISVMFGDRLMYRCEQSLIQVWMVLILSRLFFSSCEMCRFWVLEKEKFSLWVIFFLNRFRCLLCLMLGIIICRLWIFCGLIFVSMCERKLVCFWLLFFSIIWLLGVSRFFSMLINWLVGMILSGMFVLVSCCCFFVW